jgi:hypothetical protein
VSYFGYTLRHYLTISAFSFAGFYQLIDDAECVTTNFRAIFSWARSDPYYAVVFLEHFDDHEADSGRQTRVCLVVQGITKLWKYKVDITFR